ncbi:beta-mannosidase [Pedobacter sp. P351]|uniref:glycoside hydrolase 5 family protein n=1 Tax=Pedobacter superstes TaxID=3133441 RepID=UPI0030A0051A
MRDFSLRSCLVLLCAIGLAFHGVAQVNFIERQQNQLFLNNKPYYFLGANYWYGALLALQNDPKKGKERLKNELDFLKKQGVTNLRVLVGAEGKGLINGQTRVFPSLQPEKAKFDDRILESLDFLLFEMEKRNMHAVLYLSNNWEWSGGFLQYLNWNDGLSDEKMKSRLSWDELRDETSKFYSCQPCLQDYETQLRYVLNHKNKYNQRVYINDPVIMSWELANEPRPMRASAVLAYKKWIEVTSRLIKSLDRNHLVTIGTEGEMGTESLSLYKEIHSIENIDYLTLHIWPKNWSWFKDTTITDSLESILGRTKDYITKHELVADELRKPLVIEEFGLPRDGHSFDPHSSTRSRNKFFTAVFEQWLKSKRTRGSIAGSNFWAFGGVERPVPGQLYWKQGDGFSGDPPQEEQGLNSIFDCDDKTWDLIQYYSLP